MFKRLVTEDWHTTLYVVSFAVFFFGFMILLIRAVKMKREKIDYLSNLPLEKDKSKKL